MVETRVYFQNLTHDWLIGYNTQHFRILVEQLYLDLISNITPTQKKETPKIIIAEPEPIKFLASFIAACTAEYEVFLCNPNWGDNEWQQVLNLVQPDIIWGISDSNFCLKHPKQTQNPKIPNPKSLSEACPQDTIPNRIMVPTGGSSGKIKFAVHTWATLIASVEGFRKYFEVNQINSVCVLPLYHVSGLMQFMRAFTTGGKLAILPFKQLESGEIPNIDCSEFFISLVPTQLQRLLEKEHLINFLSRINTVLLGGAPAWKELLDKAINYQIRLSPTYGMTETASQIVTLKPEDFLCGKKGCGRVLPHAQVLIGDDKDTILPANQIGKIKIKADSLCLGYYQAISDNQDYFQIDDIGYFDEQGYLHIIGRNSDKIITGGENVYPGEIEAAILSTGMVGDICVVGITDKYWGQAITAVYVPKYSHTSTFAIQSILKYKLSKFKIPKYWIPIATLPRNAQGKLNRQEILKIANHYQQSVVSR